MTEQHMMKVNYGGGREGLKAVTYPPNSNKSKEAPPEKEKIEKVVTGKVTQRKKPLASRFSGSIISEGGSSVMQYLVMDVLLPAAKSTISDVVSQGIDRLLFGEARSRSAGTRPGYTNYSKPSTRPDVRQLSQRSRSNHEFDEIVLETRAEADEVIERLRDLLEQFEVATVADLYDLVGITTSFTDNKWGWYDLRDAGVRQMRHGYLLNLPRTEQLD